MNAVNPASSAPTTGGDHRLYEPSMEEILASIRRIIADDQMLPVRTSARDASPFTEEPRPASVEAAGIAPALRADSQEQPAAFVQVAPKPAAAIRSAPARPEPPDASMVPHGQVSAPQFPAPDKPVVAHPDAPHSAIEAPPPVSVVADQTSATAHAERPSAATLAAAPGVELMNFDAELPDLEHEAVGVDPYFDPPIERDEPLPKAETPAGLSSPYTKQTVTSAFNMLAATRLADNSDELLGLAREMIRPLLKTWLDDNLPSMVERLVRAEIERVARGGR